MNQSEQINQTPTDGLWQWSLPLSMVGRLSRVLGAPIYLHKNPLGKSKQNSSPEQQPRERLPLSLCFVRAVRLGRNPPTRRAWCRIGKKRKQNIRIQSP